jgi:hypothetical protein
VVARFYGVVLQLGLSSVVARRIVLRILIFTSAAVATPLSLLIVAAAAVAMLLTTVVVSISIVGGVVFATFFFAPQVRDGLLAVRKDGLHDARVPGARGDVQHRLVANRLGVPARSGTSCICKRKQTFGTGFSLHRFEGAGHLDAQLVQPHQKAPRAKSSCTTPS